MKSLYAILLRVKAIIHSLQRTVCKQRKYFDLRKNPDGKTIRWRTE